MINSTAAEVLTLDNPDKFLNGMVEVKFNLNVDVGGRFITSELELLNEVLVGNLSETSALISV